MKKYYIITPMNEVEYVGDFEEFRDAWEFLNYESNQRFVWLISENSIKKLQKNFRNITEKRDENDNDLDIWDVDGVYC